jgi:hypothetical protein
MKINFFGCSFTEGGGLDNFDYYNSLTGKNFKMDAPTNEQFEEVRLFKQQNRYSEVVGNILNLKTFNYAIGCNSNEGILKNLIDVSNSENTNEGDIFVVQTSFFSRKFYWYEPFNEFLSINALNPSDWPFRNKEEWMPLHQLHNLNVQYCHNEQYEIDKLIQNMKIYNAYFEKIGLKLFWVPWPDLTLETYPSKIDEYNKKMLEEIPNTIYFNDMSMGRYCSNNKLLIFNDLKESKDSHKSLKGHKIIGEKIAEYLKDKI